jgi:hypothetical protein
MSKTIVFVHGAWMTPLSWEKFHGFFAERGYECIAPTWPHKDKPIDELRRNPPQNWRAWGDRDRGSLRARHSSAAGVAHFDRSLVRWIVCADIA